MSSGCPHPSPTPHLTQSTKRSHHLQTTQDSLEWSWHAMAQQLLCLMRNGPKLSSCRFTFSSVLTTSAETWKIPQASKTPVPKARSTPTRHTSMVLQVFTWRWLLSHLVFVLFLEAGELTPNISVVLQHFQKFSICIIMAGP